MVRRALRSILWLSVVTLAVLAQPLSAQSPTGAVPVKTYTGYFDNTAVYFTAFETNSLNFARANGLVYAPRLSLANRAVIPQMLFFPGVGAPQTVVLQTQPGRSSYNPIWEVLTAHWRGPGKMPLIASYAAAVHWNQRGLLLVQRTGILFNGPVVWINMNLNRQGGRLAPTISPQEVLGLNPAQRTIFFRSHPAYVNGFLTAFLGLEHAAGVIQHAPGAIPVPTIQTNFLSHNAIANLYEVQGQQIPVIDSFPGGTTTVSPVSPAPYTITGKPPVLGDSGQKPVAGVPGQQPQQPVGGVPGQQQPQPQPYTPVSPGVGQDPYQPATAAPVSPSSGQPSYSNVYSPIWHVHFVQWRPGVQRRLLRSLQEIDQAHKLGWVSVFAGGVAHTFNCPVVTAPQPYTGGAVSPGTGYYTPTPATGDAPNPVTSPGTGTPFTPPPPGIGGY